MAERELPPCWREGELRSAPMGVEYAAAVAAGLLLTPIDATVADVRARPVGRAWVPTLGAEREGAIIRTTAARG